MMCRDLQRPGSAGADWQDLAGKVTTRHGSAGEAQGTLSECPFFVHEPSRTRALAATLYVNLRLMPTLEFSSAPRTKRREIFRHSICPAAVCYEAQGIDGL